MRNPRAVVPESVMPAYPWLEKTKLNYTDIGDRLRVMHKVGVPYTEEQMTNAKADLESQATPESDTSKLVARYGNKVPVGDFDGNKEQITELDAVIAYLQMLGTLVDFNNYKPQTR